MKSWLTISNNEFFDLKDIKKNDEDIFVFDIRKSCKNCIQTIDAFLKKTLRHKNFYIHISGLETDTHISELELFMGFSPSGIILSGAQNGMDIQHLGIKLSVREAELSIPNGSTHIIGVVENPLSILNLASYRNSSKRLKGLIWDEDSFIKSMGTIQRSESSVHYARTSTILAARSAGLEVACYENKSLNSGKDLYQKEFDILISRGTT